jgi:acyl carrier protein
MSQDIDKIVEIIKRVGELDALQPDQDFYHAGIDSMKGMDVMLDLENEFGVTVPDDQFVLARTPIALADLVNRLRAAAA